MKSSSKICINCNPIATIWPLGFNLAQFDPNGEIVTKAPTFCLFSSASLLRLKILKCLGQESVGERKRDRLYRC